MAKNKKNNSNLDNIDMSAGSMNVFENVDNVSPDQEPNSQEVSTSDSVESEDVNDTPAFEDAQTKSERLFAYNLESVDESAVESGRAGSVEEAALEPAPAAQLTEAVEKVADVEDRQPLPGDSVVLAHLRVIDSYQPVSVPKFRDAAGLSQNAVFLLWEYERTGLVSRTYKNSIGVWSLTDAGKALIS